MLVLEVQQNFGAFISGKSRTHLRLSLPCGAHRLGYFRLFSAIKGISRSGSILARMGHHYARVVGSGIDFFMFASRMLLLMNLGFFWSTKNRDLMCNLCCPCCHVQTFQYLVGVAE